MKEQYIKINGNGNKGYYSDKEMMILHREDGPAIEQSNGTKAWYIDGKHHRLDGPAVEFVDGYKAWYINGNEYTEEEFNKKVNELTYNGKIVEIDGIKYKLEKV